MYLYTLCKNASQNLGSMLYKLINLSFLYYIFDMRIPISKITLLVISAVITRYKKTILYFFLIRFRVLKKLIFC